MTKKNQAESDRVSLIHSRSSKSVRSTSSIAGACVETNQSYIDPRAVYKLPAKTALARITLSVYESTKDKLYDRKGDTSSRLDIEWTTSRYCSVVSKSYQRGKYHFKLWPLLPANTKAHQSGTSKSVRSSKP